MNEFKCDLCEKSFRYPVKLTQHKNAIHLGLRPFKCDLCENDYPYLSSLTEHKRKEHLDLKKFYCIVCSKDFKNSKSFKLHELSIHTDPEGLEKKYHCDKCYFKSYLQNDLKVHHLNVHGKNQVLIKCEICCKELKTKSALENHKLIEHIDPDGLQKKYHCEKCDFKSHFLQKLKLHIQRVHKDEPITED